MSSINYFNNSWDIDYYDLELLLVYNVKRVVKSKLSYIKIIKIKSLSLRAIRGRPLNPPLFSFFYGGDPLKPHGKLSQTQT